MRLKDLENLENEDLKKALRENKKSLIAEKKASYKFSESIPLDVEILSEVKKSQVKSDPSISSGELLVSVVCNTANFCDSDMDVLASTAYDNSISKKGTSIPHIADHKHTSTSHVGDVKKVYLKAVDPKELGFPNSSVPSTVALVMETLVKESYNSDVFKFYENGKINQHSIGFRYLDIKLALNSQVEDDKTEYETWNKFYPSIINKDLVDKKGYFWAVSDIDLMENSCVLFGANSLTPTLSTLSAEKSEEVEKPSSSIPEDRKNKNLSLPLNPSIGKTMTLEEALLKIAEKDAEILSLKTAQTLEVAKARKEEQDRCLNILDAAKTFDIPVETSIQNIKSGFTSDQTVIMFQAIKELSQKHNPIDSSTGFTPQVQNGLQPKTQKELVDEAIKNMGKQPKLFEGVI